MWSRRDSIQCSLTPVKDEPRLAFSSTVIKRTLMRIRYCNSNTLSAVFKVMDKSYPPLPTSTGLNVRVNKETRGEEADIFAQAGSGHRSS